MELLCARSYVKFIKGFHTPAPQELVERKTSALRQGFAGLPGCVNDVGRGRGGYCFNLQDACVQSREEGTDSTAGLVLRAAGSKLGRVSVSLHRGVLGEGWGQKPQQAGGTEDALVRDKSPSEPEVWKTLLSQLPVF